ncbi:MULTISPECIES: hypothetical protein [Streptomyces]|uniref:hypothetical protein n=1 Tax=Streptomyces TaxID=1883 RepID=UPI001E4FB1FC|nr:MULTISPECIES: hypothetical protein [Streptomyces]
MGWGDNGRAVRCAWLSWTDADRTVAVAVCAAQLPAAWLLWWWITDAQVDNYRVGYEPLGGFLALVLAPLVLPVLGMVQTVAQISPAALLAHPSAVRFRGPGWAWHLLYAVVFGAAWAALFAALWDWPFMATALAFAALGALPVLGVAFARRRARITGHRWGAVGVWGSGCFGCFGLFVLAFGGGALATAVGLIEEYEPPKLSAGQLAGVWRGVDGTVLRLEPGGLAEFVDLPAEPEVFGDPTFVVCDGTGTWFLDTEGRHDSDGVEGPEERDGVVVRLDDGCGQQTYWVIGGTEQEPELFVPFGDLDAPDLWILQRD